MIIVHGGGYLFESAATFNHEILVNNFVGQDRNIVVVTINYRLGIFGFGHLNGFEGDKNVGIFGSLLRYFVFGIWRQLQIPWKL